MYYNQTIEFLFNSLPVFQNQGSSAYKPGLDTARKLDVAFGCRHREFKTIHIAGTNGKGSTAHTIAAVLQSAGYKVGLYTSPHLLDFRERMRVDGEMISKVEVVDFVDRFRKMSLDCTPSFFELTTIMAFEFFARHKVDVAIIETGLGGRLDTTNIINPELCVITNISLDHTALLGDTVEKIAMEKAGIIKSGVPVVIGEASGAVREVFRCKADSVAAPILFADDANGISNMRHGVSTLDFDTDSFGAISGELTGECQRCNAATIVTSLMCLRNMGWNLTSEAVRAGFGHVCSLTGLMGRWVKIADAPFTVCDTGHNPGGWELIARQLSECPGVKHIVVGFVGDKDVTCVLSYIRGISNARLYFTQPSVNRALPVDELMGKAAGMGIDGCAFATVDEAYKKALADSGEGDTVFIGGSTFVVADMLACMQPSV